MFLMGERMIQLWPYLSVCLSVCLAKINESVVGASHEDEEDIVFDEDYEDGDLEVDDVRNGGGAGWGRHCRYAMKAALLKGMTLGL